MADRTGQQIGKYQLLRLIGEGGFAEVYLGEHIHLGTQAAIKLLHTQLVNSEIDKFRSEARNIARLLHPNIVRVLDFDVEDRTPYLVMDYASKGTLRQWHDKGQAIPLATVVSYVKQIADALQCAHDEKLIHRDVKPENILVGRRNELLLSDFGIALIAQSTRYQGTQDMTGTIAYMSPEQIQGKPRPASDQYSLAVVVYEWLTGEKPFNGGFVEIVAQHMMGMPTPLREKVPTIPADVERVVMIALEKDYTKRFGSIMAFAKALEQASQEKIIPPPLPSPPPAKTVYNYPIEVASVSQAIYHPASNHERKPEVITTYTGHTGNIHALAWKPDATHIASAGSDRVIHIWDNRRESNVLTCSGHTAEINAVSWSPDGQYLASGSADKSVVIWNAGGNNIYSYKGNVGWWVWIRAVAWAPNGQRIAVSSDEKIVRVWVWDALSNSRGRFASHVFLKNMFQYAEHRRAVTSLSWSPNSVYLASGSDDHTVHVWNANNGKSMLTYSAHTSTIFAVAWSPDGKYIASGSYDGAVHIWDAQSGRNVVTYLQHHGAISGVTWSPNGKYIASASADKTVHVWEAINSHIIGIHRHTEALRAVAWSPNGKYIASGGDDRIVQVWVAPS